MKQHHWQIYAFLYKNKKLSALSDLLCAADVPWAYGDTHMYNMQSDFQHKEHIVFRCMSSTSCLDQVDSRGCAWMYKQHI